MNERMNVLSHSNSDEVVGLAFQLKIFYSQSDVCHLLRSYATDF